MRRGAVRRVAAAAVVAAGLVLSGCGGAAPDPTPTPTGFADEDAAFAAAEETYRAYVDALNEVDLSDPATFEDVYAWTTGALNASDRKGLSSYHAEGYSVSGESLIVSVERRSAALKGGSVELYACLDVSAVDVTNAAGESQVDPDRVAIQSLLVQLVPANTSTELAVTQISSRPDGKPC